MRISDWSSDVCSSDLSANVYVDAGPLAFAIGNGKARQARMHAALYKTFFLDGIVCFAGVRGSSDKKQRGSQSSRFDKFHDVSLPYRCELMNTAYNLN